MTWLRSYTHDNAPFIEGVDWSQHPKSTLLLVPTNDCGCGMKPIEMAREAAAHNIDFVAVSSGPNDNLEKVRTTSIQGNQVVVNTHVAPELIQRYCKKDSATALQIENGRVLFQIEGNLPDDFFKRFKSKG